MTRGVTLAKHKVVGSTPITRSNDSKYLRARQHAVILTRAGLVPVCPPVGSSSTRTAACRWVRELRWTLFGQTCAGRYLVAVIAPYAQRSVWRAVTARDMERQTRRRYQQWRRS